MTKDEERLLNEYKDIVNHRKGRLEVNVTKREGYVSVSIIAGRRWDYDIPFDKSEID
ncbi:unnamed protein product [marine sediment metagenome]|uniref:Uncharacterized protein n=1 Tax=marine sediment metagenome TaxID=412755 RepID=X1HS46_9ZZZZ